MEEASWIGLGAQFGGKYPGSRYPYHSSASSRCILSVGLGVSCSADRNIKCKINKEVSGLKKLDSNPGELIPEEMRHAGEGAVVKINLNQPMADILKELTKYPVATSVIECYDYRRP